jgi:hypothetical protein
VQKLPVLWWIAPQASACRNGGATSSFTGIRQRLRAEEAKS